MDYCIQSVSHLSKKPTFDVLHGTVILLMYGSHKVFRITNGFIFYLFFVFFCPDLVKAQLI